MAAYLDNILTGINTASQSIDINILVQGARNSVSNGIASSMMTPKEKATLLANFETNFTGMIVSKIIDSVMQASLNEVQIQLSQKQLEITQIELEQKQAELEKLRYELDNILPLQKSDAEARISMMQQQKLTEQNNTLKVLKENALLDGNKALVDAQVNTQKKQMLDVMAGINIKNEQALSTRMNAKFDEARRYVLIQSTQQNGQINKAKEENSLINSLALDANFVISDTQLSRSKAAMDAITLTPVNYTTELNTKVGQVDANA
jgi:hypothetical protein